MTAINKRLRTICIVSAVGLGVWFALEHHAAVALVRANSDLRQELSPRDKIMAENQRLRDLVSQTNGSASRPGGAKVEPTGTDEVAAEIRRLRREIEVLRQQSNELETLRADTRKTRAAGADGLSKSMAQNTGSRNATSADGSKLEIVQASYWTDNTNMDVAAELRDRIRDGKLKAIASNNLKGDPEFGQVKRLTIIYRVSGVTITNEFQENDFVQLPKEQ